MIKESNQEFNILNRVIEKRKLLGRNFILIFTTDANKIYSLKDAPDNLLLSELGIRKKYIDHNPLVTSEIIKIIENELLYRRKEQINKIKSNISMKKSFFKRLNKVILYWINNIK